MILTIFKRIGEDYPVGFLWPDRLLCNQVDCPVSIDGEPLYLDDNHLSVAGARSRPQHYMIRSTELSAKIRSPMERQLDGEEPQQSVQD